MFWTWYTVVVSFCIGVKVRFLKHFLANWRTFINFHVWWNPVWHVAPVKDYCRDSQSGFLSFQYCSCPFLVTVKWRDENLLFLLAKIVHNMSITTSTNGPALGGICSTRRFLNSIKVWAHAKHFLLPKYTYSQNAANNIGDATCNTYISPAANQRLLYCSKYISHFHNAAGTYLPLTW